MLLSSISLGNRYYYYSITEYYKVIINIVCIIKYVEESVATVVRSLEKECVPPRH